MSEKKHDIDALKKVLDFAMETHEAVEKGLADGKIDVLDAPLLLSPMMALFAMIPALVDVPHEFADLDESEKLELIDYVKAEYDLADDKLEAFVEKAFGLALQIGHLVHDLIAEKDNA